MVHPCEDDMRELSLRISKLPDSELKELEELIHKLQPSYKATGIDLQALDKETFLQVEQFVRTTLIEYNSIRILITDSPKESNLAYYLADWRFEDGDIASSDIIDDWLDLCTQVYPKNKSSDTNSRMIAIHCAAGLGRAPFLVALALIQNGMDNYECVKYIREVRKGAINGRQLNYILKFK
eukprot:Ihof_evm9s220 gene=Ihof_evmTU9s220